MLHASRFTANNLLQQTSWGRKAKSSAVKLPARKVVSDTEHERTKKATFPPALQNPCPWQFLCRSFVQSSQSVSDRRTAFKQALCLSAHLCFCFVDAVTQLQGAKYCRFNNWIKNCLDCKCFGAGDISSAFVRGLVQGGSCLQWRSLGATTSVNFNVL